MSTPNKQSAQHILRAAARDPQSGKETLLAHMDWLYEHYASLPDELARDLLDALGQVDHPTDLGRKVAQGVLGLVMKSWRKQDWSERSWMLSSVGRLLYTGILDAGDLGNHGKLNARALLRDARRYANQTPSDPYKDSLLAACRRQALEIVVVRKQPGREDGPRKRAL